MAKTLVNTTASDVFVSDTGTTVPASGSYTIQPQFYPYWAASANTVTLLTAGTLTLTSDIRTLPTVTLMIQELQNIQGLAEDTPFDNSTDGFTANQVQAAIEEAKNTGGSNNLFGDGSDGALAMSTGTFTLPRTMYYSSVTLSGTAIVNMNGFKMYVNGTLALSGTASMVRTPNAGTAGSGDTNGNGGAAMTQNDMGAGLAGQAGVNGGSNNGGVAGNNAGTANGYGGAGGASGSAGSTGTAGAAGTYTNIPERVVRMDHIWLLTAYKNGGQGGAGGAGGAASLLANGGGGGGGGSGGGVMIIFCKVLNSTSSVGITVIGGAGANGGNAPSGNSNGGGGGGGGGGGHIYIVCNSATAIGTLNVSGGAGGTGGAKAGTGSVGGSGSTGSAGHYEVYQLLTNTWTVA